MSASPPSPTILYGVRDLDTCLTRQTARRALQVASSCRRRNVRRRDRWPRRKDHRPLRLQAIEDAFKPANAAQQKRRGKHPLAGDGDVAELREDRFTDGESAREQGSADKPDERGRNS